MPLIDPERALAVAREVAQEHLEWAETQGKTARDVLDQLDLEQPPNISPDFVVAYARTELARIWLANVLGYA